MARKTSLNIDHLDETSRASAQYWRFGTALGVEITQKQFENAVASYKKNISLQLSILDNLIKSSIDQENSFFLQMELPRGRAGLDELQSRIAEWNASGADCLLSPVFADEVYNMISFDYLALSEALDEAFLDIQGLEELTYCDTTSTQVKNKIIEVLNSWNPNTKKFAVYSKVEKGLAKFITQVQIKNGKIHIDFDPKTPSSYGRRISKILEQKDPHFKEISPREESVEFAKKIKDLLRVRVSQKQFQAIEFQLDKDLYKVYGMYSNQKNIRGGLAEIYWNAAFSFLMGQHGYSTIPTGLIKQKGKQINIDMVLEGFGFQIKEYRADNNTLQMHNIGKQAGTLFSERALVSGTLLEILLNFFASWSYNQIASTDAFPNAQEEYGPIYKQFETKETDIEQIMRGYLNEILEIERESVDKELATSLKLQGSTFRNTFFLINGKVVPSSAVLYGIKESLMDVENMIELDVKNIEVKNPTSALVWPSSIHKVEENKLTYANRIRISYDIKLDVAAILTKAYNFEI